MQLTAYIILLVARILVPLAQSGAVFNCSATKSEQPDNLTPLEISLFRNAHTVPIHEVSSSKIQF
jgi:hypothetical protein